MYGNNIASGKVAGTGAALNVSIGFKPRVVCLINVAAGGLISIDWNVDMGEATGFKRIATGVASQLAALGVSQYAGSQGANTEGFTIGADADMNVNGEYIHYIAYR